MVISGIIWDIYTGDTYFFIHYEDVIVTLINMFRVV